MEMYPGIEIPTDHQYRWCIMLKGPKHRHLLQSRVIGWVRPTDELAASIDSIVGKGCWVFQSQFAGPTDDIDEDRMALWFRSESDRLAVKLMLID